LLITVNHVLNKNLPNKDLMKKGNITTLFKEEAFKAKSK
jgi:hypothetical protein